MVGPKKSEFSLKRKKRVIKKPGNPGNAFFVQKMAFFGGSKNAIFTLKSPETPGVGSGRAGPGRVGPGETGFCIKYSNGTRFARAKILIFFFRFFRI